MEERRWRRRGVHRWGSGTRRSIELLWEAHDRFRREGMVASRELDGIEVLDYEVSGLPRNSIDSWFVDRGYCHRLAGGSR